MKTFTVFASLLLSLTTLSASPILTLTPGTVTAVPGQSTGWGFSVTSDDTYYIAIVAAFVDVESNPNLGFFVDWISLAGGPVNSVMAPNAPTWSQAYSPLDLTGFGEFSVDSSAVPGDQDVGAFLVLYQRFSADPNTCSRCFVDTQTLSADFTVTAINPTDRAAVPEPSTSVLIAVAMLAALIVRRYRNCRRI